MKKYLIEEWWRHNGCYDREQASGIPYDGDASNYLRQTDDWWESKSDAEKKEIYEEFFSEE